MLNSVCKFVSINILPSFSIYFSCVFLVRMLSLKMEKYHSLLLSVISTSLISACWLRPVCELVNDKLQYNTHHLPSLKCTQCWLISPILEHINIILLSTQHRDHMRLLAMMLDLEVFSHIPKLLMCFCAWGIYIMT